MSPHTLPCIQLGVNRPVSNKERIAALLLDGSARPFGELVGAILDKTTFLYALQLGVGWCPLPSNVEKGGSLCPIHTVIDRTHTHRIVPYLLQRPQCMQRHQSHERMVGRVSPPLSTPPYPEKLFLLLSGQAI